MTAFSNYHHIHLVGIKGVAMTALAQCLSDIADYRSQTIDDSSLSISGSDVAENFVTSKVLEKFGFEIVIGFSADNISGDIDLVIYTGAHNGKHNIEVQTAIQQGIPTMTHAEALGKLMEGKRGISVCGTGGKSTTSAMIAWILECAGIRPSYAIGVGNVPNLDRTGKYVADSEWFVAEADEYAVDPTEDHRPRFIYQHPEVIVCTNLNYDHPDIYPTFDAMKQTFEAFFKTLPTGGTLLTEVDLPKQIEPFHLLIPGIHNQQNAYFAMRASKACGVDELTSRNALSQFASTMRRFEYKGKLQGIEMYDDYAHTPDEISATIQALREWRPGKRVVVAFQPHTYSRTKALFDGFVSSLSLADEVILLDIFASAREQEDPSVSSSLLASRMTNVQCQVSNYNELAGRIPEILKSTDVFITMGAGDIYKVYEKISVDQETR